MDEQLPTATAEAADEAITTADEAAEDIDEVAAEATAKPEAATESPRLPGCCLHSVRWLETRAEARGRARVARGGLSWQRVRRGEALDELEQLKLRGLREPSRTTRGRGGLFWLRGYELRGLREPS